MPECEQNPDTEMKSQPSPGTNNGQFIDLDHYRKLVRSYLDMRRYKTALFWAEKVVILSNHDPRDIYWEAQCMFLLGEYHRAAHIIKLRGLEKTNLLCHYLAVESLLEAKEYAEAIELLNSVDLDNLSSTIMRDDIIGDCENTENPDGGGCGGVNSSSPVTGGGIDGEIYSCGPSKTDILSAIWLLKGKVLEAMDNRSLAMECYVQALQLSVYCTEALDLLVQHEMLMVWEEEELMSNLDFSQQCSENDAKIITELYRSKLKKYYETESPIKFGTQTPTIMQQNTMQSIRSITDRIKNERYDEQKFTGLTYKQLFTPGSVEQRDFLSPANKLLHDLRTTPSCSIQANLSKSSFKHDSIKAATSAAAAAAAATSSSGNVTFKKSFLITQQNECRNAIPLNVAHAKLQNSLDLMVTKAEQYFYNCEYKMCMDILDETFKEDPYHSAALIVQIGCLVELKESNKLFYLAHKLVDLYPDLAISWYAVGCYYDIIGKSDPARRYLSKATTLDRLFGPAWLAYGHSFAKENEHDQAMAAYFKATQLMRGCHLPLLYIGVECGLTKNLELAEKFFYQAMSIAPLDVFVLHELGVIKYEYEDYTSAEDILRSTFEIVIKLAKKNNESISSRWEPLLNNLGHCCRKNKKYNEALKFHQQALVLKPQSASTYTAIGLVQALIGKLENAIESLHRSLAIRRDDIITSALLKYCIEDLVDDDNELPDDIYDVDNSFMTETTTGGGDGGPSTSSLITPAAGGAAAATCGAGAATAGGNNDDTPILMKTNSMLQNPPPVIKLKLKYDDSNINSPNSSDTIGSSDMSMDV